ncbi:MAG TPA: hypothetical protein P5079_03410 [Elusimicrobiota bacterium]|nr:hypothetical protein [Elusimicrobiota bacterium]
MSKAVWGCALTGFLLCSAPFLPVASAGEVDEDALFSSPEMVTQPAGSAVPEGGKKTIGFSGEMTGVTETTAIKASTQNIHHSYLVANGFIDARLKNDMKAFANLETVHDPEKSSNTFEVRELFFDFNVDRRVYLRTGKQVLQWGRCGLWNPTDLVNIERKRFIRKIGYREGAYGLKLHAPFGARQNIYGFLDTGEAPTLEDLGGALKYEFLVGNTEMAFSGWAKKTYDPVWGYDFSTRLGEVDVVGEASVSRSSNKRQIFINQGMLDVRSKEDEWTPRASINFSRGFRMGNFNDRLRLSTEFFYDHSGYKKGFLTDSTAYPFAAPLVTRDAAGNIVTRTVGTKASFLLDNDLYEMNQLSRHYGALFLTFGRFLLSDMALNVNYVRNFDDSTGVLSSGVTYRNLSDLTLGLLVNTFTGPAGEYTYPMMKYNVQLTGGISF